MNSLLKITLILCILFIPACSSQQSASNKNNDDNQNTESSQINSKPSPPKLNTDPSNANCDTAEECIDKGNQLVPNEFEEATGYYEKAIQLDPANRCGYLGAAGYYMRLGPKEKAAEYIKYSYQLEQINCI